MKPLRILFQAHKSIFEGTGGDQIQFNQTKEGLEKLGHRVDISLDLEPDLSDYDVIHLFNLHHPQDLFLQAHNARRWNKPVALSTIYWSLNDLGLTHPFFNPGYREPFRRRLKRYRRSLALLFHIYKRIEMLNKIRSDKEEQFGFYGQAGIILSLSDILLPNSLLELEQLKRDFPAITGKSFQVVFNGINSVKPSSIGNTHFSDGYPQRDYVLCVGRLEKRKNQINLLKALQSINRPIVLLGRTGPRLLRPCDLHLESWPHEKMNEIYAHAAVHVLPSLYDTPGLASLEAASCGIPIVTGNRGSESEYFGEMADYCNPEDLAGIRAAVEKALRRTRPNTPLLHHVMDSFTWEKAAIQTEAAYYSILANRLTSI